MANILDYIKWRGDLDFLSSEFNEIDNLILSQLAYIDFDKIVPDNNKNVVTLRDAATLFFTAHNEENIVLGSLLPKDIITLLKLAAESIRFGELKLSCYVNHIDKERQEQFSALTFELNDGLFIAFRGTDDTLVGWKEDFNMCFINPVPSQEESVKYLDYVFSLYAKCLGKIRIGGHSKGGNLAVYSATFCLKKFKEKIIAVYNNDGPGFNESMIKNPLYQEILNKVTTFVPQTSVVGMLLEHEEPHIVVYSTAKGLFQHDVFSWQLMGKSFTRTLLSESSRFLDKTLKNWLANMDNSQRMHFVDVLFEVLSAGEIETLSDFEKNATFKTIQALISMNNEDKKFLFQAIRAFWDIVKNNFKEEIQNKKKNFNFNYFKGE